LEAEVMDRETQIENLLESFRSVHRKMAKAIQSMTADLNITYTQLIILGMTKDHEGFSIKELSTMMGMSSSAATQQVDSLVKKGYLVREGNLTDRRAIKIRLSNEMLARFGEIKKHQMEKLISLFETLSDQEIQTYCRLSQKIIDGIGGIEDFS
jgi:DNA-binding MarR family transcriptional regulator